MASDQMERSNLERVLDWLRSRYDTSPDTILPLSTRLYTADGVAEDVPPELSVYVSRREFDDFLMSIDAPRQETINECRRRGWITPQPLPSFDVPEDIDFIRPQYYKIHRAVTAAVLELQPGYLGLIVDYKVMTVRRKGHKHKPPVDLSRKPALWQAFLVLFAAEDKPGNADWSTYEEKFDRGGRRTVISQLRVELTGLHVGIADRNWHLIENVSGN